MTEERTAVALERIATALEQMALNAIPADALPTGEPPLPTPPPDEMYALVGPTAPPKPATVPLPPVQAPSVIAPALRWAAGMNHAAGHKPLKENNRGLYCPTKLPDGTWCQWAVKGGMTPDAERVLSMLGNAHVTQPDMAYVLGLKIRAVQAACEELRRQGFPVLSDGDGMRLAASADEALACAAALRRRAATQFLTARALRRAGLRMLEREAAKERLTLWEVVA